MEPLEESSVKLKRIGEIWTSSMINGATSDLLMTEAANSKDIADQY